MIHSIIKVKFDKIFYKDTTLPYKFKNGEIDGKYYNLVNDINNTLIQIKKETKIPGTSIHLNDFIYTYIMIIEF